MTGEKNSKLRKWGICGRRFERCETKSRYWKDLEMVETPPFKDKTIRKKIPRVKEENKLKNKRDDKNN